MKTLHTPAPWTLNENETAPCELIGNGTIHIADIYMTDFPAGKADSLLIAAAPDYYSLAEHILAMADDAYLSGHPEWEAIVTEAKALQSKVTP